MPWGWLALVSFRLLCRGAGASAIYSQSRARMPRESLPAASQNLPQVHYTFACWVTAAWPTDHRVRLSGVSSRSDEAP